MKYLKEFILSFFTSIILSTIGVYITNNIVAGIGIFTASLVSSQFLLNRYENRIDVKIEAKITQYQTEKRLSVSIINKGGKTIYLKSGGIITQDRLILDFDDVNKKIRKNNNADTVVENKSRQNNPLGILKMMEPLALNSVMSFVKPYFPFTLNPGQ